ncbi:MAG TPA: uroporphyrinogen-III C-methyltransferase [Caulobacteraceae bacterium]|nr:uroporphyrinogen-III C-methyltransferase [Caulobacteraceae bacterium]
MSASKSPNRLVPLSGQGAQRRAGEVWLVGAGPGDPELLTLKALKALQGADVVVHDGLVSEAILDLAPAAARRLSVAKRKSRHSYAQDEINRLLVAFALEGLTVVRLKGGDPFIFGRGGEELEACRAAGVVCHVVPGVTAALAAGASAGAPLTHRGAAQAVTFVTGHAAAGGEPDLNWASLARPNQTVVIYMGVSTAASIAARLIGAGRAGSTPALVVEDASLPTERRIVTTLAELPVAADGLTGPALLIVGEAMALAHPSPLRGGVRGGGLDETRGPLPDGPRLSVPAVANAHPQPLPSRGRGVGSRR